LLLKHPPRPYEHNQGDGAVVVTKTVGVVSGGTVTGNGVGGATVPVASTSNVAVGVGWITGVETVSRIIGAYSLYGPIGGTVAGGNDGSAGTSVAVLSSRKAC
jgi:hypothetical protein